MPSRNQRERDRLRAKRADLVYIAAERRRNKARMRQRRKLPEYQRIERANKWWK